MSSAVLLRAAVRSRNPSLFRAACYSPQPAAPSSRISPTPSPHRSASPPATRAGAACSAPAAGLFGTTGGLANFSTSAKRSSGPHDEETFDEFTARYEREFDAVQDVFDLQRNLNNSFAYDLVPSTSVVTAALKAARRVNDFPTAVRIFEGIKAKVENKAQYEQYLEELEPLRQELGIELRETLYPELPDR
ncbi:MAG: Cytochrome c oxidase subunit 6 [Alyxoria varia]|nr:MAG: Cytochrome c oxidase subunit 6 [Alyxoria varia]